MVIRRDGPQETVIVQDVQVTPKPKPEPELEPSQVRRKAQC